MKEIYVFCKIGNHYGSYSLEVKEMNLDTVEQVSAVIAERNDNQSVRLLNYHLLEETMEGKNQFYLIKGLDAEKNEILWSECYVTGGIDSIEKVKAIKDYMSDKFNVSNYEVISWEVIK